MTLKYYGTLYNIGDTVYVPETFVLQSAGKQILARVRTLKIRSILINVNEDGSHSVVYKDGKRPEYAINERDVYETEEAALKVAQKLVDELTNKTKQTIVNENPNP